MFMANVTFTVPTEIYDVMKKYNEIRWSVVVQKAIKQYVAKLEKDENFLDKYSLERLFSEGEEADEIFKI